MTKPTADVRLAVSQASAGNAMKAFENRFKSMMGSMEASVKKQSIATKAVSKDVDSWGTNMAKVVGSAGAMYAAFSGIRSMVSLVRQEYAQLLETQNKAKETQLSFNDAMEDVRFTLPADAPPGTHSKIRQMIVNSDAPDKTALANAVRGTMSAGLTEDPLDRTQVAVKVAELMPHLRGAKADQLQALSESVMISRRVYGGTVEEQLGTMIAGASAARITDIGKYSRYIAGAQPALAELGYSQKGALSLLAAYSNVANDAMGETSGTNVVLFASQLHEEARKRGEMKIQGDDLLKFVSSPTEKMAKDIRLDLAAYLERDLTQEEALDLAAQNAHPNLRGKSKGKIGGFQFLQADTGEFGDGHIRSQYEKAREVIVTGKAAAADLDRRLRVRDEDPAYLISRFDHANEDFTQRRELDPNVAMRAAVIEGIKDLHLKTRGWGLSGSLQKGFMQIGSSDASPESMLESYRGLIDKRQGNILTSLGMPYEAAGNARRKKYRMTADSESVVGIWEDNTAIARAEPGQAIGSYFEGASSEIKREAADLQRFEDKLVMLLESIDANGKKQPIAAPNKPLSERLSQ